MTLNRFRVHALITPAGTFGAMPFKESYDVSVARPDDACNAARNYFAGKYPTAKILIGKTKLLRVEGATARNRGRK